MDSPIPSFTHSFAPGTIAYGRGCVSRLDDLLAERGAENALVVCGTNVGDNDAVMSPIRDGLGDRLADVFAKTTPEKSITTAFEGVERMREVDADALVGVGSGSSLDIAAVMSVLWANDQSLEDVRRAVESGGGIDVPPGNALAPLFSVPTTFAGADLSAIAGINVPLEDGRTVGSGVAGTELLPAALCYDPDLFETTPQSVLTGSAMNGFDKGIEALYSRNANPITDATAIRGLGSLRDAFPKLADSDEPEVMERAVLGVILVQYGVSIPGEMKLALIHAFGHGLRRGCGVQQGIAHAVMAPHVLAYVFERVDGRREALAEALNVDGDDLAAGVVEAVTEVRDELGLPALLREVEGVSEDDLPRVAELTHEDAMTSNGPPSLEPTTDEIEAVLRAAW